MRKHPMADVTGKSKGKSMKAVGLAPFQNDSWRKIAIALID
jgi:hypothetical protein